MRLNQANKTPTLSPKTPQSDEEDRVDAVLDAVEKENHGVEDFIKRLGDAIKDLVRKS
jgi:hypothetical protein